MQSLEANNTFFLQFQNKKLLSPPAEFLETFTVFLILQGAGNGRFRHTKKYQKKTVSTKVSIRVFGKIVFFRSFKNRAGFEIEGGWVF